MSSLHNPRPHPRTRASETFPPPRPSGQTRRTHFPCADQSKITDTATRAPRTTNEAIRCRHRRSPRTAVRPLNQPRHAVLTADPRTGRHEPTPTTDRQRQGSRPRDLRLSESYTCMASVPTTFATRGRSEPLEVQTHHRDQTHTQHHEQQNHVHHRLHAPSGIELLTCTAQDTTLRSILDVHVKRLRSSRGHTLDRSDCRSSHPRRPRKPTCGQLSSLNTHATLTCRRDAHALSPPPLTFLGFGPHNHIHHCLLVDPRFVTQITFAGNVRKRINAARRSWTRTTWGDPRLAARPETI